MSPLPGAWRLTAAPGDLPELPDLRDWVSLTGTMHRTTESLFFAVVALTGLVVTAVAMERWAPESATRLPATADAARSAAADSQALGYRVY
ncbi:MAG: hypothetical protein AAFY88_14710, partial [Acidobacteriota bacterium]